jgi:hypothetical protein
MIEKRHLAQRSGSSLIGMQCLLIVDVSGVYAGAQQVGITSSAG